MKSAAACCCHLLFAAVGVVATSRAVESDLGDTISAKYERVPLAHLPTLLETISSLPEQLVGHPCTSNGMTKR